MKNSNKIIIIIILFISFFNIPSLAQKYRDIDTTYYLNEHKIVYTIDREKDSVVLQSYSENSLDGICRKWGLKDSILYEETYYHMGLRHGRWRIFYKNGNAAVEFFYDKGVPYGTWRLYHENGEVGFEIKQSETGC